jgi:hypothetical protein
MTYPAKPDLVSIAERLRDRTAPLAPDDDAHGYAHAYLCGSLGAIFAEVAEVFDPEGDTPPLAPLLDPTLCPAWALPWLAQMVGIVLPDGLSEADARTVISEVAGFKRGTRQAMEAAAKLYLTGDRTVYFRERDPSGADPPYTLEVVTFATETPDSAAVLRALVAAKPGGIVLNYRMTTGWDYQQMTTEGGAYSTLPAKFSSYRKMSYNERT